MNSQRAQEIAQSPEMKNVTHNGVPIYIQHVNSQEDTARVNYITDPGREFDAQLTNLQEE